MTGQRRIFEEQPANAARAPSARPRRSGDGRRIARLWLGVLFVLVVAMIAVGGLTRLTDSGLSITEWRPVTGAIPPLSEADWQAEFEKYQQIPEFRQQNSWMTLEDFRSIYWWEWGHRLLGRIIGLVWALGWLGLWATGRMPRGWAGRLALPGLLGALQGAIGWWMVRSGLEGEMLDVASYRLAVHLGLAFAILGLIAWYMFQLGREPAELLQARRRADRRGRALATGLMHLSFLQILLGALVAGIDAGRTFTDWPLMAGQFFPPDAFELRPLWRNFFENEGLVQFMHRIGGYLVVLMALWAWWRMRRAPLGQLRRAFAAVAIMALVQMALGIGTVVRAAPLPEALSHQLGAVVLWILILRARFLAMYPAGSALR